MDNIVSNMRHTLCALMMAAMVSGVSSCSNDRKDTDTSSSTNTSKAYEKQADASAANDAETMDADANAWMQQRDQYVTKHRETLDKIDNKIAEAEKSMKAKNTKSQSAMKESINSLKLKRDQFEDKLKNVEQSTQANWTQMQQEVDEKATELNLTYEAFDKQY